MIDIDMLWPYTNITIELNLAQNAERTNQSKQPPITNKPLTGEKVQDETKPQVVYANVVSEDSVYVNGKIHICRFCHLKV